MSVSGIAKRMGSLFLRLSRVVLASSSITIASVVLRIGLYGLIPDSFRAIVK